MGEERNYGLRSDPGALRPAPELPYRPPVLPRVPRLGLVGCGGISATHPAAYRVAGYEVVALCDRTRAKAEARRAEFFPGAEVTTDAAVLLARDDLDAVDLTPHPADRAPLIEAAIEAGLPVLSQKPLAADLDTARALARRAEAAGVPLAVNQNGRFAPHMAWMRAAVNAGLVGEVASVRVSIQWDHDWVAGTAFDRDPHLVLHDFGIHWFDLVASLVPADPTRVRVSTARTRSQRAVPPLLAGVLIDYEDAQASLVFDGHTPFGAEDRTRVLGARGALRSVGPPLEDQRVTLWTAEGWCEPELEGSWFPGAFHGAMAELLDAAWSGRPPLHAAREHLRSLELCHAAIRAAGG